jgi:TatD DNase family protein
MGLIIDVHCHLDHIDFEKDIDQIIDNAKKIGITSIITSGINPDTNRAALRLASKFDIVKCSLGIYPPDALEKELTNSTWPKYKPFDIDEEIEFIRKNKDKVIAIGEVGLDYKEGDKKEFQAEVFQKMINLAKELDKPLIIHSRKAEAEVIGMLEKSGYKKIMLHCFCGKKNLVKKAADNGWYFSVPTNVVKSEQFQNMVKIVNISQLLTETDAPYLSPFPGKRNEPAFVIESVKKIAEIKGFTFEDTMNTIYLNYKRLFE